MEEMRVETTDPNDSLKEHEDNEITIVVEDPLTAAREALDKELKSWSVWLAIIGVSQFIMPNMDTAWGIVLLVLAITSRFCRRSQMLIVLGGMLIYAAISNLLSGSGGWSAFAIIQFVLGIQQINAYRKFKILDTAPPLDIPAEEVPAKPGRDLFATSSLFIAPTVVVLLVILVGLVVTAPEEFATDYMVRFGFIYSLATAGSFMGVCLSLASLLTPRRKRVAAILGLIGNLVLFALLVFMAI